MAFYLSSKNIRSLQNYSLSSRRVILQIALGKLITPEKVLLNIIKILLLVPIFLLLTLIDSWLFVLPISLLLLLFYIVMQIISLNFAVKYLPASITEYDQNKEIKS